MFKEATTSRSRIRCPDSDIKDFPAQRFWMPHGGKVGGHGIGHVGEVAGLFPISEDGRPPALRHPLDEERDHTAIGARRILTGPEDVEITQAHAVEPHGLGVDSHIMLAGQFSGGIGAQRFGQHVFVFRQLGRVAVGAAGRREHESTHPREPRRLEHVDRGGRAALMRGQRLAHGAGNARDRRQMEDVVYTFRTPTAHREIRDGPFDPLEAPFEMGKVRQAARGKVIDDADPIALGQQRLDQMGTDEPGPPRYQC